MEHIFTIEQAAIFSSELKQQGKRITLVGGCFDILHPGHIQFLRNAKAAGDVLMLLLESDKKITDLKGKTRPIHTQKQRAEILASLRFVDIVVMLPYLTKSIEYDKLVRSVQPSVIAVTNGDSALSHKIRQANECSAKVVTVTDYLPLHSTSNVAKKLEKEL